MNLHDEVYKNLKSQKHHGWGGAKYDDRMIGLDKNMDLLLETLQIDKGTVLELGSGAGDLSIKMCDRGFHVTGIEISQTAVNWSNEKKKNRSIDFLCESVTSKDILLGATFDLILDGNCLHCLFDQDRHDFYWNVLRWLKEDGHFYLASVAAKEKGKTATVGPIPRCFKTIRELKEEANHHGLICVHEWCIEHENHNHFRAVFKKEQ